MADKPTASVQVSAELQCGECDYAVNLESPEAIDLMRVHLAMVHGLDVAPESNDMTEEELVRRWQPRQRRVHWPHG